MFPLGPIPLLLLALAFVVLLVLGTRGEPDPNGDRPYLIYLFALTFVGILIALSGLFLLASSLTRTFASDRLPFVAPYTVMTNCQGPAYLSSCGDGGWVAEDGGFGGPIAYQDLAGPFPSESWFVGAVSGLAVVLVGVALARFHGRRAFELADAPGFRESPGRRPYEFYLYTTAFIAILVLAGAVAGAVRALVGVALPGSFRYDSLLGSLGLLISFAAVALGAWFVFRRHWRRIEVLRAPAGGEPSP